MRRKSFDALCGTQEPSEPVALDGFGTGIDRHAMLISCCPPNDASSQFPRSRTVASSAMHSPAIDRHRTSPAEVLEPQARGPMWLITRWPLEPSPLDGIGPSVLPGRYVLEPAVEVMLGPCGRVGLVRASNRCPIQRVAGFDSSAATGRARTQTYVHY